MIGLSYHAGGMRDLPLDQVLKIVSDAGYDTVEMMCGPEAHIPSDEVTDALLKDVAKQIADHGLTTSVINPFAGPGLYSLAVESEQKAVDHYTLLLEVAAALGGSGVNFLSGYGGADGDTFAWKLLIDVLKPICARAETMGLTVNIHNHEAQTIDTEDKVDLLMRHVGSDALRPLIDITNFYHLGSDIGAVTERFAARAKHCHIKGVKGMYPYQEFVIPGDDDDELDFVPFAKALGKCGFDGNISTETFPHMRIEKAQIAYDMMSGHLKKLGLR